MQSYYNTNQLQGENLVLANSRAESLQDKIESLYEANPGHKTPFEVQVLLFKMSYKYPLTSVRRALTNLSKAGKLFKSEKATKMGEYNSPNHTWGKEKLENN